MSATKKRNNVGSGTAPQGTVPMPSPEMRTPAEYLGVTADVSYKKINRTPIGMFLPGFLAGLLIGIACIATFSVTYLIENPNVARLLTALLFPFGLVSIVFSGAELFTGNVLICVGVLEKKAHIQGMIRNWFWVYFGNFVGSMVAVFSFGSTYLLHGGNDQLAVAMMKTAQTKVTLSFGDALLLGALCNILVTLAILFATGARDPIGKVFAGLIPISLFVMSGFEHCVANMFYIPIGVLAAGNGDISALAVSMGVNVEVLTVGNFLFSNLLPVTVGNLFGGLFLGCLMWFMHRGKGAEFFDCAAGSSVGK